MVLDKNSDLNQNKKILNRFIKILLYMIEPLLFGIVLGMIPVTIIGLFVAAYLQYKLGKKLGL